MSDILLYRGDCLDEMNKIPDKSVDLILTDPPYNIGKAKWDKIPNYVEWCGKWFKQCERLLKDNGSFYFWHNDMVQIAQLMEWIRKNTQFVFKRLIVWDKFNGSQWNQLNAIVYSDDNRNYSKQAEYCLFYTLQDETGLSQVLKNPAFYGLQKYFKDEREKTGITATELDRVMGIKASYCYWEKPTTHEYRIPDEKNYVMLQKHFGAGFFSREYESLRREYESLRYTFNNSNLPSVWQHEPMKQNGHITPKPIKLLENIINTSSNEGDAVLDCFMGSGSTGVACMNTNRRFIGIELDAGYFSIAQERIRKATEQVSMADLERIVIT